MSQEHKRQNPQESLNQGIENQVQSSRQQILIVDDREENLYVLEAILSETTAEIVRATSGNAALATTLDQDFALAILDVQMPGMNGYELAEILRSDDKTSGLPIIFLTAASLDEQAVFKGYEAGAVDYIVKPYNPAVLLSKVKVFLELHRQKTELHRQRVLLQDANRELEAFAYSVSHDLRAPLRTLNGFSQILLEDQADRLDENGRDAINRIRAASIRMAELIDGLLQLSRLSKKEIHYNTVDLSALAQAIAAELREQAPAREVEFVIAPGISVFGDRTLLRAALENLLGNAWKFTSRHERARIEFGVTTKAEADDGVMICFVRDDGAGFDMAYAEKLFGTFQRLHGVKEFPGTGIGLATVQRIIHRHGGRIWAEGEVEKGACFYFTLGAKIEAPPTADS